MSETTSSSAGTYTVVGSHVPVEMATRLAAIAAENERSISGEIRLALRRHIESVQRESALTAA